MPERTHGFKIDEEICDGRLACMRACPTHAIRVKDGKAKLLPELCIDCGLCLSVCPSSAIKATTQSFAEIDKFKYKVAVPCPTLLGQFPPEISPAHIAVGLRSLGFDAVWDFAVELALVERAIADYIEKWQGPFPLISVYCPVIVRLVQVLYPSMVDQLIHIQTPRELAGRELKQRYSQELGIEQGDIAAIYITPCQAKTISILEPAEGARSNLDGALGISDVYNEILAVTSTLGEEELQAGLMGLFYSTDVARWSASRAERRDRRQHRCMSVTGLPNVIQVFDDIEKGKLRNIEYLDCYGCWGGCIGGNLAVDNLYVTLSKLHRLLSGLPQSNPQLEAEVERRYATEDFSLKGRVRPRTTANYIGDLKERVKRVKTEEAVMKTLPGLNCGLCGTPDCKTFAKDVARGAARQEECVLLSDERMRQLREIYFRHMHASREEES